MQVVLQGSVRHFPVAELLTFLCSRSQSGTLDLEEGERRVRVLYQDDRILHAESSRGGDAQEAVLEAFEWMTGSFILYDEARVPETVAPVVLELVAILEEARRRAEAASSYPDATFFRVVDDPALQQQVSLTADQFKLLFRLTAGKTFRDLVAELGIPKKELAERLRNLHEVGLVTIVEAPQPPQEITAPQRKIMTRKRTLVGSLTPDGRPDNVYPLLDSEHTIGRTPDNTIVLAESSVSSRHARLYRNAEGFFLEDLQSRNGTFANGERVTEKRKLEDGDLLRFGKVLMTFNIAREAKSGEQTRPEGLLTL